MLLLIFLKRKQTNLPLQLHRIHWTDTRGRFGRTVLKHLKERDGNSKRVSIQSNITLAFELDSSGLPV